MQSRVKYLTSHIVFMHTVPVINVTITSTHPNPVIEGASVNLTCIVEMSELVESDLELIKLEVTLYRNGSIPMNLSQPAINGTTSAYTHQIVSFNRNDSGNYSCVATARAHPSSIFINDNKLNTSSNVLKVTTGNFIATQNNYSYFI